MNIFISWSGKKSKEAAKELKQAIRMLLGVDPWMSETDLSAGMLWEKEIKKQLSRSQCCIVCLTKENLTSPWMLFEAGFVASSTRKLVCPYLIDLTPADIISSPLYHYQARQRDRDGTRGLITAINKKLTPEMRKREDYLGQDFDRIWPDLEEKFHNLLKEELITEPMLEEPKKAVETFIDAPKPVPSKHSPPIIYLFNTYFHRRSGHISIPFNPIYKATGIDPRELIVRDKDGDILLSQVDNFHPHNADGGTLVFSLKKELVPVKGDFSTPSSYVTLERGAVERGLNEPRLEVVGASEQEERVYLINNRLSICLELYPEPFKDNRPWYSGSVTSVRLEGSEVLDHGNSLLDLRDKETRCMQLDQLQLFHDTGGEIQHNYPNLIRGRYQLISASTGPARASVVIASQPFNDRGSYNKFRLYRVISLHNDTSYLTEELKVVGTQHGGNTFTTRYFSYMEMGFDPHLFNLPVSAPEPNNLKDNPKYFAVSCPVSPYQAYGFGSDVNVTKGSYPHSDFPDPSAVRRTFSWELSRSMAPRCIHVFSLGTKDIEVRIRRVWHDVIDNPLVAIFPP